MRLARLSAVAVMGIWALLLAVPAHAGGHGGWGWGGPRLSFSFGWPRYYPYYGRPYYVVPYYPAPYYPAPYYPPPYYPPPYYYRPYAYAPPSAPYYPPNAYGPPNAPNYPSSGYPPPSSYQPPIQQSTAPPSQKGWYYCDNPRGYFPDIESCNTEWRQVPVSPPEQLPPLQ